MSTWTHRVMIITSAVVEQARQMAELFGPAASGMWTTPLSATGAGPVTHYISAGLIDQAFADMLTSPEALQAGAAAMGVEIAPETCAALLSGAVVAEGDPFAAMAELGLQMVQAE